MGFIRENKYIVIKRADCTYLDAKEREALNNILDVIYRCRLIDGKNKNSYVVVNENEPYAEQVWKLIQEQWEKEGE